MHSSNSFITLTYNDANLPSDGSVKIQHFQRFMKRLRKSLEPKQIRFFACGEYGDSFNRPHYHALLFGHQFPDQVVASQDKKGTKLYRSASLEKLWEFGFSRIGEVTFQSAAYVARYVIKKVNGPLAERHYESLDLDTGELTQRKPEYIHMSLKPGIGQPWYEKYKSDIFPSDFVVLKGRKHPVPKFYDQLLELENPKLMRQLKEDRKLRGDDYLHDKTPRRLKQRETCTLARVTRLKRTIE